MNALTAQEVKEALDKLSDEELAQLISDTAELVKGIRIVQEDRGVVVLNIQSLDPSGAAGAVLDALRTPADWTPNT